MSQQLEETRFRPTSGLIMGTLTVLVGLAVAAIAVIDPGGVTPPVAAGAVLVAVLGWASMLWPRVSVTATELVLRTMGSYVRLPLAAIEELAVRQVLAVRVGDKRYVSTAVGKTRRKVVLGERKRSGQPASDVSYADYIEQEIRRRMDDARAAAGVGLLSDEQLALADGVRRQPAWLPIGLISAALLGVVLALAM